MDKQTVSCYYTSRKRIDQRHVNTDDACTKHNLQSQTRTTYEIAVAADQKHVLEADVLALIELENEHVVDAMHLASRTHIDDVNV